MKHTSELRWLLALLGGVAFTASADVAGDYKVILERNPFGLRPPPPPAPPPTNAPPETPTNYKLSGITALFKPARAMFVNQVPGKPTPEYISLSEGQRQGSLEVLVGGIDLKKGLVRVKISGEERTLSFEKDGLKAAAGPAMPMNPVPARPGGTVALPPSAAPGGGIPAFTPTVAPTPAMPAGAAPESIPVNLQRPIRGGTTTIPINSTQAQPTPPDYGTVDPAAQQLKMLINEKANPGGPPMPPTDLKGMLPPTPR